MHWADPRAHSASVGFWPGPRVRDMHGPFELATQDGGPSAAERLSKQLHSERDGSHYEDDAGGK